MNPIAFAAAGALDALAGDPRWFPHPVRAMGFVIGRLERLVRRCARGNATGELAGGGLIVLAVAACSAASASLVQQTAGRFGSRSRTATDMLLAWSCIAARDLVSEVNGVLGALNAGGLEAARLRLSRIVGRDTAELDRAGIARALIETLAESLCDGIVAPLCALAIGGPPLAFAFKVASTMDSMIGHIEPPYRHVGFFAAKLDDALCYVPARIAALAVAASAPLAMGSPSAALRCMRLDGAKHASPNAGRVEAAMAGALAVRLGGSLTYDGVPVTRALFGGVYRAPDDDDVRRARLLVVTAALLLFALLSGALGLRSGRDER